MHIIGRILAESGRLISPVLHASFQPAVLCCSGVYFHVEAPKKSDWFLSGAPGIMSATDGLCTRVWDRVKERPAWLRHLH